MLRRCLYGALAGLLLLGLAACTNSGSRAGSTTTSRGNPTTSTTTAPESTTVTTVPPVLASSTPDVKLFLALLSHWRYATFLATYRETEKLKHGGWTTSVVVVASALPAGGVSATRMRKSST